MKTYARGTPIDGRTLFFTAAWCGPCQQVKRALAKPDAAEVREALLVVDIDTAHGDRLAEKYGVQCIPTFVRPDGERQEGAIGVRQLKRWIHAA